MVLQLVKRALYPLGMIRYCPVCDHYSRSFLDFGQPPRPSACCPQCMALERHRLAWWYLKNHTNLLAGASLRVLHFAPEPFLEKWLRAAVRGQYTTTDISPARSVDLLASITELPIESDSFDVVLCSHVLEHVEEDRQAMRELYRITKTAGWLLVQVPLHNKPTYEDFSIRTPAGRLAAFGQDDHVRIYGLDVIDRLKEVGFEVERLVVSDLLSDRQARRMELLGRDTEELFICRKS